MKKLITFGILALITMSLIAIAGETKPVKTDEEIKEDIIINILVKEKSKDGLILDKTKLSKPLDVTIEKVKDKEHYAYLIINTETGKTYYVFRGKKALDNEVLIEKAKL